MGTKTKTYRPKTADRARTVQKVTMDAHAPFYVAQFPSVAAFVASVTVTPAEGAVLASCYSGWGEQIATPTLEGSGWTFGGEGFPTSVEAIVASIRGRAPVPAPIVEAFEATRREIRSRVGTLKRTAATLKRSRCYRIDDGAEIDVDRMLGGDPAFWRSRTRGKKRPTATLAVQLGQTADGTPTTYARVIAIATAAVEVIEAAGVSVRVLGCYGADRMFATSTEAHNATHPSLPKETPGMIAFALKGSDEPLVAARMLAFGQPGAHRTLGFAARALLYGCQSGMGRSWVPPMGHPIRGYLGVDHWIGRAPRDGQQIETLEGILRDTVPGML